jgi:hypothetical protein
MNRKIYQLLLAIIAVASLASCSGLKNPCTVNCGGGSGNSSLSITISDTPPANTTILSFNLPVIGITLTPSSGSQVPVFSSNPSADFDLTRLQSDTNLITSNVTVAAGTYTAINVTVAAPNGVFVNSSGATVGSCAVAGVCSLSGSAATITYTFPTGSPLTLTSNSSQWVNLDFNYNNAIVTTNGIGIDVTQSNVLTASTTIPTNIPSGDVANIDDFTGAITALSSSSITVQSSVRGSLTALIGSGIPVYDPPGQCTGGASLSCIGVGSIVSVQSVLTNTGSTNATSVDIIDKSTSPADEVEGIIYPSSCNGGSNFGLILSDSTIFTSGSPLLNSIIGSGVCLSITQTTTYAIDTGILTNQAGVPTSLGFSSSADLVAGQMVRAKITGAVTGTNGVNATATAMILRFSRLSGTVNTVSGGVFSVTGLPTYLAINGSPQVYTYSNATILEGTSSLGSLAGEPVSFSALYLNPNAGVQYPFQAVKVRAQ